MAGNPFDAFDIENTGPITVGVRDPAKVRQEARDAESDRRDEIRTGIAVRGEGRQEQNTNVDNLTKLASNYNSDPTVKAYRVAIQQLAQAIETGEGPQADLALTYAFAKAMDPDSVVRESEQGMVTSSQPWFQAVVEQTKKQFGMDGAGNFTPQARKALREQIVNSVAQRAKLYDARRDYFANIAQRSGIDPQVIIGKHDAAPFVELLKSVDPRYRDAPETSDTVRPNDGTPADDEGLTGTTTDETIYPDHPGSPLNRRSDTMLGQTMSGLNEGLADAFGAPADLVTGALNMVPRGLNAFAGTNIPTIPAPFLGSDYIKDRLLSGWAIHSPTDDPTQQFVRRTAESVGSAAVPGFAAGSLPKAGAAILSGLTGGASAATAQQVAPGNKLAEMLAELAGGGLGAVAGAGALQRSGQRAIEAAVPNVEQLKDKAGELYRAAEARGVTAEPMQTTALAEALREALRKDGRISPTGRISEVYPKAKEAVQLVDDYSGQSMNPTQMQVVRNVVTDGLMSKDANERRIASNLTDSFDDWAAPLAPELPQARDVASRYLTAQQLEKARELAGARAGQFSGSGFENALRTEYRALDRGAIKGSNRFSEDVGRAVEDVSRGTTLSNIARGLGRMYPNSPVPFLGNAGLAGLAGAATGSPTIGGAALVGSTLLGGAGRAAGTRMGIRNADLAELTARNGGALPQAEALTPELRKTLAMLAAIRASGYEANNP